MFLVKSITAQFIYIWFAWLHFLKMWPNSIKMKYYSAAKMPWAKLLFLLLQISEEIFLVWYRQQQIWHYHNLKSFFNENSKNIMQIWSCSL